MVFFYSWHKSDCWKEFFKIVLFFVASLFLVENQIHTVVPEWYMGHHFLFSGTILNDKKVFKSIPDRSLKIPCVGTPNRHRSLSRAGVGAKPRNHVELDVKVIYHL